MKINEVNQVFKQFQKIALLNRPIIVQYMLHSLPSPVLIELY